MILEFLANKICANGCQNWQECPTCPKSIQIGGLSVNVEKSIILVEHSHTNIVVVGHTVWTILEVTLKKF